MPEGMSTHDFVQHVEEFGKFKAECAGKFGKYESDIKTLFQRADKQDAILKSLESLNYNVGTLTKEVGSIKTDFGTIRNEFHELKTAPYKKWEKIGFELLKYVVLLGAGIIAGKFGLV